MRAHNSVRVPKHGLAARATRSHGLAARATKSAIAAFGINCTADLIAAKKSFATRKKTVTMPALSEYNYKAEPREENESNGWALAEGICRMFNGGVTLANIWPLRYPGIKRSMLGRDKEPLYPWQILKLFSDNFSGDIIKCAGTDRLFMFATKSAGQITLVVTARAHDKQSAVEGDYEIAFDADAAKGRVVSVRSFATDAQNALRATTPAHTLKRGGMSLHVAPGTFTMIVTMIVIRR